MVALNGRSARILCAAADWGFADWGLVRQSVELAADSNPKFRCLHGVQSTMQLASSLLRGTLVRRYKRFLAEVDLDDGRRVTAHCANPGRMTGLAAPGLEVWLEHRPSPRRRLAWSWKLVRLPAGDLVGVDTTLANQLVAEALAAGSLPEFAHFSGIARERPFGAGNRVDFLLGDGGAGQLWLEVKNVTLVRQPGLAEFPDTVTRRGARHLRALAGVARAGGCAAAVLYVVQRDDCGRFRLAGDLDPDYARAAAEAAQAGVATFCRVCRVGIEGIALARSLAVEANPEAPC